MKKNIHIHLKKRILYYFNRRTIKGTGLWKRITLHEDLTVKHLWWKKHLLQNQIIKKEKKQIFSFRAIPITDETNLNNLKKEFNSEYERLII